MATPSVKTSLARHVAEAVESAREATGISVSELSKRSGIPYETLRRRLAAQNPFDLEQLVSVAEVLGVSIKSLIPDE